MSWKQGKQKNQKSKYKEAAKVDKSNEENRGRKKKSCGKKRDFKNNTKLKNQLTDIKRGKQ